MAQCITIHLPVRRRGFDPWVGRSCEEGNGNTLQYTCLEKPVERGAWWATVHGVTKSWTQLSNWVHTHTHLICISPPNSPFVVVQSLSHVQLCDPTDCNTPGYPVLHHLSEFAQTHVHWVCDAILPYCPLSSPFPPAFNLPSIRIFSNELAFCIRWSKYWSFSISPSSEYAGLISFRVDWFNLLVGRRQWHPTPELLPGRSHGWRSLVGCSPWGR